MMDRRQFAPATERNREPILDTLKDWLPGDGTVLEIASGSGEHAVFFAPAVKPLKWQTSNFDREQLDSVTDWLAHKPSDNLLPPVMLDVTQTEWSIEAADYSLKPITAIFNANMIHISPWQTCEGLMAGASRILPAGGRLFLYGPFKFNGQHTAPSNKKFEEWLKSLDPEYGIRNIEDVREEAVKNGIRHIIARPMPANNFFHLFEKI
ncbi:DUF938 domain-containing protein [Sneathiella sp. HT1-7]|uniref:DUF938 domain-containing protein n=1 Tax=Sneathiella sp. HT1-7 TaxID=2887192 RepID=UPI001D1354E2|nr:DUF938 domain-containing protein [Sneathiella sp. HT1-7]MCC3304184.1 class I SAM-dependent methyltransferase [Sneathiella sp. HT1-7]